MVVSFLWLVGCALYEKTQAVIKYSLKKTQAIITYLYLCIVKEDKLKWLQQSPQAMARFF